MPVAWGECFSVNGMLQICYKFNIIDSTAIISSILIMILFFVSRGEVEIEKGIVEKGEP